MNWIKRIGNAFARGWKYATDKIMEFAAGTRVTCTVLSHYVISKLRGQDPKTEPSGLARGIGTLLGMIVLVCGSILVGQYVGLVCSTVVNAVGSTVIGLGIFGHIMADKLLGLVKPSNIVCAIVLAFGLITTRIGYHYIDDSDASDTDDEEAPAVAETMHS